jgi:hypothetical protein
MSDLAAHSARAVWVMSVRLSMRTVVVLENAANAVDSLLFLHWICIICNPNTASLSMIRCSLYTFQRWQERRL